MVRDSPDTVGGGPISDLGDLEGWRDKHSIVIWSFALFGCFLLNVILLLAFLVRPSLRTISNRFVMNLTVSNLLVCAIMNPLMIMDAARSASEITESSTLASVCGISEGAMAMVTTSSVLSVLLIAVDQYFAVVDPLRYRAHIDKLKSGVLILSIWLISLAFGFLAFFDPNPRGFWLSCVPGNGGSLSSNTTDTLAGSTIDVSPENRSSELNVSQRLATEMMGTIQTVRLANDTDTDLIENATMILDTLLAGRVTYGFVYALVYSVFAFFIPFVAVCWIYVSIYVAAHRNSERARRSGSRPILSSASFTEEQQSNLGPGLGPGPCSGSSRLQRILATADTVEDFRKLPKISSLSSIDETSESQATGQVSRRRSFSSAMEIQVSSLPAAEDKIPCTGIVFMLGPQRLELSPNRTSDSIDPEETGDPIVPREISNEASDGQDAGSKETKESAEDSTVPGRESDSGWLPRSFVDESSGDESQDQDQDQDEDVEEDETRFERYNALRAFQSKRKRFTLRDYSSAPMQSKQQRAVDFAEVAKGHDPRVEARRRVDGNETEPGSHAISDNDPSDGFKRQQQQASEGDMGVTRVPQPAKTNRRASMVCGTGDTAPVKCNCETTSRSNGGSTERNEKDVSACLLTPIVTITPAPSRNESLHRVSSVRSTSSYINSLRDRISNGSIFRHREEARAARISALVIVMGLICWSPYVILLVSKNLPRSSTGEQCLPARKYDALASSLLILAAYISPLLFGYRSKRVKRELRRFFCFRRELSYRNNRSLMAKKVLKRRHSSTPSHLETDHKYNIFSCVYGGRNRWAKEKGQFVQVPDTALAVETCRSSFSSGASTQISTTSTEEC